MPFKNQIVGGDFLVRNQIESQNFAPGTSGWIIRRDGSAEFNDVVARGSVVVGPDPGAHIIIDAATDTILVYDAANQLSASISPTNQAIGGVTVRSGVQTYDTTHHEVNIRVVGNQIQLRDLFAVPTATPSLITPNNLTSDGGHVGLVLQSGSVANNRQSALQLFSESGDTTGLARILATQDNSAGASKQGLVVQTDTTSQPHMTHVGSYTGTVIDAFGDVVINHGCAFTPAAGTLTYWDYDSSGRVYNLAWFQAAFTSTQMSFFTRDIGGGIPAIGTGVGVQAILIG